MYFYYKENLSHPVEKFFIEKLNTNKKDIQFIIWKK